MCFGFFWIEFAFENESFIFQINETGSVDEKMCALMKGAMNDISAFVRQP